MSNPHSQDQVEHPRWLAKLPLIWWTHAIVFAGLEMHAYPETAEAFVKICHTMNLQGFWIHFDICLTMSRHIFLSGYSSSQGYSAAWCRTVVARSSSDGMMAFAMRATEVLLNLFGLDITGSASQWKKLINCTSSKLDQMDRAFCIELMRVRKVWCT